MTGRSAGALVALVPRVALAAQPAQVAQIVRSTLGPWHLVMQSQPPGGATERALPRPEQPLGQAAQPLPLGRLVEAPTVLPSTTARAPTADHVGLRGQAATVDADPLACHLHHQPAVRAVAVALSVGQGDAVALGAADKGCSALEGPGIPRADGAGWTRTSDLQVMSLASYRLLHRASKTPADQPRLRTCWLAAGGYSREERYGSVGGWRAVVCRRRGR